MKIEKSLEDYLETILMLSKNGNVRAIDIAKALNFSKPSVSVALKNLKAQEYITVDSFNHINLTDKGLTRATSTLEKHELLIDLFIKLGVPEEVARIEGCQIEHHLSDISFACIKKYYLEHIV